MSLTVRPAVEADLPAVTALYAHEVLTGFATFEETPPTVEQIAGRFETVRGHDLPWLIAEVDGVFAGYAYATPFRPRAAYRWSVEESIYVAPAFQARGVGRALLTAVIDGCRARGMRHVIAAISGGEPSVGFHAALGFRHVGTYRDVGYKFGRWHGVDLMQLDLAPDGGPPIGEGLRL